MRVGVHHEVADSHGRLTIYDPARQLHDIGGPDERTSPLYHCPPRSPMHKRRPARVYGSPSADHSSFARPRVPQRPRTCPRIGRRRAECPGGCRHYGREGHVHASALGAADSVASHAAPRPPQPTPGSATARPRQRQLERPTAPAVARCTDLGKRHEAPPQTSAGDSYITVLCRQGVHGIGPAHARCTPLESFCWVVDCSDVQS